jgi:hypothetical protein
MRKLLCIALVIVATLSSAFTQSKPFTLRVFSPVDVPGTTFLDGEIASYSLNLDTDMGFGIGAEAAAKIIGGLYVGLGAQYLLERAENFSGVEGLGAGSLGEVSYLPLYGLAIYKFEADEASPYFIARIGYSIFSSDTTFADGWAPPNPATLTGGLCYMVGAGVTFKIPGTSMGIFGEANYAVTPGRIDSTEGSFNQSYQRCELCAGISADF